MEKTLSKLWNPPSHSLSLNGAVRLSELLWYILKVCQIFCVVRVFMDFSHYNPHPVLDTNNVCQNTFKLTQVKNQKGILSVTRHYWDSDQVYNKEHFDEMFLEDSAFSLTSSNYKLKKKRLLNIIYRQWLNGGSVRQIGEGDIIWTRILHRKSAVTLTKNP